MEYALIPVRDREVAERAWNMDTRIEDRPPSLPVLAGSSRCHSRYNSTWGTHPIDANPLIGLLSISVPGADNGLALSRRGRLSSVSSHQSALRLPPSRHVAIVQLPLEQIID